MLAYSQGGAKPTSGAQANMVAADYKSPLKGAVGAAQSASSALLDVKQKDANIASTIAQVGVADEQRKNLSADTYLKILEAPNVTARTKVIAEEGLLMAARRTATNAEEAATRLLLPKNAAEGEYYKKFGYAPFALRDAATGVSSATSAFKNLIGK
jgi:hypothetical protein